MWCALIVIVGLLSQGQLSGRRLRALSRPVVGRAAEGVVSRPAVGQAVESDAAAAAAAGAVAGVVRADGGGQVAGNVQHIPAQGWEMA